MEINPHMGVSTWYIGATSNYNATKNNYVFHASRVWRTFTKKKYLDTFSKLSVGSNNALLELKLLKPEDEMDHETF